MSLCSCGLNNNSSKKNDNNEQIEENRPEVSSFLYASRMRLVSTKDIIAGLKCKF